MFMCASSVCLRAVSSGRAVMAALRWAALELASIWLMSLTSLMPVVRVISAASVLYLGPSARRSICEDRLGQLRVDLLGDLRKRTGRILRPEEVLGVEIVRALGQLARLGCLRRSDRIATGDGAPAL